MIAPRSRVSFTILASGGCILYNTLVNSYAARDIVPRLQRALLEISLGKAYEQIFDSCTAYGRKFLSACGNRGANFRRLYEA